MVTDARHRVRINRDRRHNGGNLLAVNAFYLQIIIGALILATVPSHQWQGRRT